MHWSDDEVMVASVCSVTSKQNSHNQNGNTDGRLERRVEKSELLCIVHCTTFAPSLTAVVRLTGAQWSVLISLHFNGLIQTVKRIR